MRIWIMMLTAGILSAPVQAAAWPYQTVEVHTGAFVGARVHLSLGGNAGVKPRASLGIAPTQMRISSDGITKSTISEGIALSFTSRANPTVTLGGIPADAALGLRRSGRVNDQQKLGVSTGGGIAIGVGVVLVAGAVGFALLLDSAKDNSD